MNKRPVHICASVSRLFLIVMAILISGVTEGQLLTMSPAFPQDTSSISIVVDCSKGNLGLNNYGNTGDVYVHVGLITNLSANSGDWQYSPFTWGTTPALAKATFLGNNKYLYTINNIRSFFGVHAGETVLKVAILFRNGAGTLVQRNSDGSDMYLPIFGSGLAVQFIAPPLQPEYVPVPETIHKKVGDSVTIKFACNNPSSLNLFFNGMLATHAGASRFGTAHRTYHCPR